MEIASLTNDERLKHQLDLVFLLSLAAIRPADDLDAWTADVGKKDRQRLKAATEPILGDDTHRARTASNMDDVAAVVDVLLRRRRTQKSASGAGCGRSPQSLIASDNGGDILGEPLHRLGEAGRRQVGHQYGAACCDQLSDLVADLFRPGVAGSEA